MMQGWKGYVLIAGLCAVLGLTCLVLLSSLGDQVQADMKQRCDALEGKLVFYECMSSMDLFLENKDRCVNKMAGYVCELSDGSEVQFHYDVLAGEVRP